MQHVWLAWSYLYDDDQYCGHHNLISVHATKESARVPALAWIEERIKGEEPITERWNDAGTTLYFEVACPEERPIVYFRDRDETHDKLDREYYRKLGLHQNYSGYITREEVKSSAG